MRPRFPRPPEGLTHERIRPRGRARHRQPSCPDRPPPCALRCPGGRSTAPSATKMVARPPASASRSSKRRRISSRSTGASAPIHLPSAATASYRSTQRPKSSLRAGRTTELVATHRPRLGTGATVGHRLSGDERPRTAIRIGPVLRMVLGLTGLAPPTRVGRSTSSRPAIRRGRRRLEDLQTVSVVGRAHDGPGEVMLPVEPWKAASPKVKMPPSAATSQ